MVSSSSFSNVGVVVALLLVASSSLTASSAFTTAATRRRDVALRSSSSSSEEDGDGGALSRRQLGELTVATLGLGGSFLATRETKPTDYGLYGVLPVGPYKTRTTVFETLVEGALWTATQKFGILDVQVPQRATVVKYACDGDDKPGLFVYDPVAATPEVVSWLRGLEKEHGPVKDIVLGSVAIEHKVYTGVLAQKFPAARVWLQPGQYSFPANLPESFLGFPAGRTRALTADAETPPEWTASGLSWRTLGPFISRDGAFGETVFHHAPTKTLLVTDTVVEVTDEVPPVYDADPAPLLYHARDTVADVVEDTPETRRRGYRRVLLFGLFFQPDAIRIKTVETALAERRPDVNADFAGIYPWDWVGDDAASFEALKGGLLVAPILQKLILNRNPVETLDFATAVSRWDTQRIVPAHLKNDLKYTGEDYLRAFDFLTVAGPAKGKPRPLDADFKTLDDANVNLLESGAIAKAPPLPGGDFSRADILARSAYGCRAGLCGQRSPDVL